MKTLPEERTLGVLPRYLAAGGGLGAFFLSKLLTAALLSAPSLLLLMVLFRPRGGGLVLLTAAVVFLGAFGLFALVAAWARDGAAVQRWGNLILLLSLVVGGALYPRQLLSTPAQALGTLTLPHYVRLGLDAAYAGAGAGGLFKVLWPALAMGVGFAALGLSRFTRGGGTPSDQLPQRGAEEPAARPGRGCPLGSLALLKGRAMSGGALGLCALAAVTLLCGTIAGMALKNSGPDTLTIAVTVADEGPHGRQLAQKLSRQEGVKLLEADGGAGHALLDSGAAEGLLTIGAGYSAALERGEAPPLSYESAGASVSAQAAREIVAGQAAVQMARLRGVLDARGHLGRALSKAEEEALFSLMDEEEAALPPLYHMSTLAGGSGAVINPFAPQPLGFAALAVMLTVLTLAAWTGRGDVRRVEGRMAALRGGRWLSYFSDALALILLGLTVGLLALLPGETPGISTLLALGAYVLAVTGLALGLTRHLALSGRVDALAPFVALITCLVGGCFGDLGQASPLLRRLSLLTPQGLALRGAVEGGGYPVVLAALGIVLLFLGRPRKAGKT